MPLYEYKCRKCGRTLEVIQAFSDPPRTKCDACGGRLDKLISRSGFILKGGGWYKSDYGSPSASKKADEGSSSESSSGSDSGEASAKAEKPEKPSKAAKKKGSSAS